MEFEGFPKLFRFNREIVVTEKLDGTNAQIYITDDSQFIVGSRNKYITPNDDNAGFAKWAHAHKDELIAGLGPGRHFGEWWGRGIQRGYGLQDKVFSLFNTARWGDDSVRPECCSVVPVLWTGALCDFNARGVLDELAAGGSIAAPGFMKPEGIVVFHTAANQAFKMTLDANDAHKGVVA